MHACTHAHTHTHARTHPHTNPQLQLPLAFKALILPHRPCLWVRGKSSAHSIPFQQISLWEGGGGPFFYSGRNLSCLATKQKINGKSGLGSPTMLHTLTLCPQEPPESLSQPAESQHRRPEAAVCHLEKKQGKASSKGSAVTTTEMNNANVERGV